MKRSGAADSAAGDFTEALMTLGFSQYEARCYVGLLGPAPQTGYAVSKATGVPQPKVYEALRKLVSRGAARQLAGEPVRFAAVPPAELLNDLENTFEHRLVQARQSSADLQAPAQPESQEPVTSLSNRADVIAAAANAIGSAVRRVYLSASSGELTSLQDAVTAAADAGVDVVILSFGRVPFQIERCPGVPARQHRRRGVPPPSGAARRGRRRLSRDRLRVGGRRASMVRHPHRQRADHRRRQGIHPSRHRHAAGL